MQDFTSYAKQPSQFEILPAGGYILALSGVTLRTQ